MKLAILGAGGHGGVVADIAEATQQYQDIVFFDDRWPRYKTHHHWQLVGVVDTAFQQISAFDAFIVAIGNNRQRQSLQRRLEELGAPIATLMHPSAVVSRHATIGAGSVLVAGAIINIGSVVGRGCIINTGATVGHDCVIEDAVHIAPGSSLGGGTHVGEASWIGIRSCSRQLCKIGADVMVGAGSVLINDIPSNVTVAGNPARELPRRT